MHWEFCELCWSANEEPIWRERQHRPRTRLTACSLNDLATSRCLPTTEYCSKEAGMRKRKDYKNTEGSTGITPGLGLPTLPDDLSRPQIYPSREARMRKAMRVPDQACPPINETGLKSCDRRERSISR